MQLSLLPCPSGWLDVDALLQVDCCRRILHLHEEPQRHRCPGQELYRWPLVADTARKVLAMRYSLLPYLYTVFYHVSFSAQATE